MWLSGPVAHPGRGLSSLSTFNSQGLLVLPDPPAHRPAARTHCPRSSTEGRGFFACLTLGTEVGGSGCEGSGGSGQRGRQRRGCPPRRGWEAGSVLALARLSGRACSAARSPATLGSAARPPLGPVRPRRPAAPPQPVARHPEPERRELRGQ
jgi:hypothetical protein